MSPEREPPDDDRPRLEDPIGHARAELRRRLERIGCSWMSDETKTVHGDKLRLTIHYMGRDEHGHLAQCRMRIEGRPGDSLALIENRVEKQARFQERCFEIAGGIDPVVVGPTMPLSHLEVSAPYARRLRLDHGDGAQDALRQAIAQRLAETCKAPRSKVANQPAFCGHRVNHREQLGEGVWLRSENIVIENTTLPEQVAIALVGRPARAVCDHPVLADGDTVAAVEMSNTGCTHGRRTVTVRLDVEWIRGDRI